MTSTRAPRIFPEFSVFDCWSTKRRRFKRRVCPSRRISVESVHPCIIRRSSATASQYGECTAVELVPSWGVSKGRERERVTHLNLLKVRNNSSMYSRGTWAYGERSIRTAVPKHATMRQPRACSVRFRGRGGPDEKAWRVDLLPGSLRWQPGSCAWEAKILG